MHYIATEGYPKCPQVSQDRDRLKLLPNIAKTRDIVYILSGFVDLPDSPNCDIVVNVLALKLANSKFMSIGIGSMVQKVKFESGM